MVRPALRSFGGAKPEMVKASFPPPRSIVSELVGLLNVVFSNVAVVLTSCRMLLPAVPSS